MKKIAWLAGLAAGLLVLAIVLTPRSGSAGPSSLSASKSGWLAARRYLELSGSRVSLLGQPLAAARFEGTLVVTLPEESPREREDLAAMTRHVRGGGTLLLAFSGKRPLPGERLLGKSLGLGLTRVRGDLPLSPSRWYRFVTAVWDLRAEGDRDEKVRPVRVAAPRWIPVPRAGAAVLFRGPGGEAMVFSFPLGRGRVFALPADALSNSRLSTPGNADLLESLRAALGPRFLFDEYHHGFSQLDSAGPFSPFPFDLLLAQLGLLYLLAVLTLARRFGASWKETSARTGSAASFLTGVAARHRQLGHFRRAGELLLERLAQIDPSISPPRDLDAASISDEKTFLDFAKRVSSLRGAIR